MSVRPQTTTGSAGVELTGAGAVEEEGGYAVRVTFLGAVALGHEAEPALHTARGEQGADGRRAVRHGLAAAAVRCDVELQVVCDVEDLSVPCAVLCYDGGPGGETGPEPAGVILTVGRWARSESGCAQRPVGIRIERGSVYAYCEGLSACIR